MLDSPTPPADLTDVIADAAANPQRIQVGAESAQEYPLRDVIEADRYLAAKGAARRPGGGVLFTKFVPGGAV